MSLLWPSDRTAGSDSVAVQPGVWIRNRRRTRAWAAISVLYAVVFACLPFVAGGYHAAGLVAFDFALAAVGLVLAARVARSGVLIRADGIVVRGPFRTQAVALRDAGRFSPGLQGRGGNGTPCPMLDQLHRRPVGVWALGRRNIWFRYGRLCQEIKPLCDELTALVELVGSTGRHPPSNGNGAEQGRAERI